VYYAFKRPDSAVLAGGGTYRTSDLTADVEGGLDFLMKNGLNFSIAAAYRGIGQDDIERVTLRGDFRFKW